MTAATAVLASLGVVAASGVFFAVMYWRHVRWLRRQYGEPGQRLNDRGQS